MESSKKDPVEDKTSKIGRKDFKEADGAIIDNDWLVRCEVLRSKVKNCQRKANVASDPEQQEVGSEDLVFDLE